MHTMNSSPTFLSKELLSLGQKVYNRLSVHCSASLNSVCLWRNVFAIIKKTAGITGI